MFVITFERVLALRKRALGLTVAEDPSLSDMQSVDHCADQVFLPVSAAFGSHQTRCC